MNKTIIKRWWKTITCTHTPANILMVPAMILWPFTLFALRVVSWNTDCWVQLLYRMEILPALHVWKNNKMELKCQNSEEKSLFYNIYIYYRHVKMYKEVVMTMSHSQWIYINTKSSPWLYFWQSLVKLEFNKANLELMAPQMTCLFR